jgi:hypothetical protein
LSLWLWLVAAVLNAVIAIAASTSVIMAIAIVET